MCDFIVDCFFCISDVLLAGVKDLNDSSEERPHMWKADIESAFRRIPVKPAHRWAAAVVVCCQGKVGLMLVLSLHAGVLVQMTCSQYYAMPLSATASVIAWERVGSVICQIVEPAGTAAAAGGAGLRTDQPHAHARTHVPALFTPAQ